jgi:nitrate/TMAO reductase-like tetraheme cytochrome c subunit
MKGYSLYRRSIQIISIIVVSVILLTKCISDQQEEKSKPENENASVQNVEWTQFAGSGSCEGCHKDIYESHLNTAHYLTSQPVSSKYIKGSFDNNENTFVFSDRVKVVMEEKANSFYQVAYLNGVEKQRRRFDIIVGSGTKGQSYLNWINNGLFQMPITYFTAAHQWSNSPGYPGKVVFNRPISSRCLECHSTFVQKISAEKKEPEEFDRNKIVYGVDCEKCHGPGADHVAFQTKNPGDTAGRYISNPSSLSRQQNLDLCALCHGGRMNKTSPSFGFKAGDKLADYFVFDTVGRSAANIDVHGNQYGLLAASKCFQMSQMNCTSCHNPHENEKAKIASFSQRCLSCHNSDHNKVCKMNTVIGPAIENNCIDCHMPKQASRSIAVLLQGSRVPTPVLMRTHLIKIYPDQTREILDRMKLKNVFPTK